MPHCVYKIWSTKGDKVYYGSTCNKRGHQQRFNKHICEYKSGTLKCTSKYLFDEYGVDYCQFSVIEIVDDLSQLRRRERFYIENNPCVNEKRPSPTEEQIKQDKQQYTKEHKQQKKEYDSQYRNLDVERKIKIECYCGGSYVKRHRVVHENTIRHLKYTKK